MTARTDHGYVGIYNATDLALSDTNGSALATDARGVLLTVPRVGVSSANVPSLDAQMTQVTKRAVKASAGNMLAAYVTNDNAAVRYFQLHNKATTPAGTDVPLYSFKVPAGTANAPGTLILDNTFFTAAGAYFSTGIGYAISTTFATFTDAATASEHIVAVHFI